jgi:hypothetical protein
MSDTIERMLAEHGYAVEDYQILLKIFDNNNQVILIKDRSFQHLSLRERREQTRIRAVIELDIASKGLTNDFDIEMNVN